MTRGGGRDQFSATAAPTTPPDCSSCDDAGRVPWMVEADPHLYQEPDADGTIPCLDCHLTPPGKD